MKGKKKNQKVSCIEHLEEFKIYRDPETNEAPEIKINLADKNSYIDGIKAIRKILGLTRENDVLIPIQVWYDKFGMKGEAPVFYMRCSNAYIVGSKKDGEDIRVFSEDHLRYGSTKIFDFSNIAANSIHTVAYVVAEAVRSKAITKYITNLINDSKHILNIEDNVFGITPLSSTGHSAEVSNTIHFINDLLGKFSVYKVAHTWSISVDKKDSTEVTHKLDNLINSAYSEILSQLKKIIALMNESSEKIEDLYKSVEYWKDLLELDQEDSDTESTEDEEDVTDPFQFENWVKESLADTQEWLDELFLQFDQPELPAPDDQFWEDYTEAGSLFGYYQDLLEISVHYKKLQTSHLISDYIPEIRNRIFEDVRSPVKCLTNSTNIDLAAGTYTKIQESKSTGSDEYHYSLSLSYFSPDDDKGSGAISLPQQKDEEKQSSILSWIELIENLEVKQYLLSLSIVQNMERNLENLRSTLEKPAKIDFIIKNSFKAAMLGGCILKSIIDNPHKTSASASVENLICTGLVGLSGITSEEISPLRVSNEYYVDV